MKILGWGKDARMGSVSSLSLLEYFVIGIINQLGKWRAHSAGQAGMRRAIPFILGPAKKQ